MVVRAQRAAERLAGHGLRVAPMTPDRAGALTSFHARLSPDTTRRRFFSPHPWLSPVEVARFTDVDHGDREALVAVDEEDRIVGVARFDRLGPGSPVAEVAFVVEDAWQHRGVGAALFDLLVARAVVLGVGTFVAETLPENRPMLAVFRHAGLPVVTRIDRDAVHVELTLPAPPAGPDESQVAPA